MYMDTTTPTLKVNSLEEVYKACVKYFNGDTLAADVWAKKYCLKDDKDNYYELTPDDMHRRIAKEISRIESIYANPVSEDEIFESLQNFLRIVPQGGPMSGIGNNLQTVSLSNCFVIGDNGESDSYGGILKIDQEQIQLMKRRGGVGHDLSHIRPKGSPVKNSALTSTGIVPFMERYSNSTKEVAQDGRRGALMLSISVKHPDSESFIDAKLEQGKITGANISIKLDDAFMLSRKIDNGKYIQQYPINSSKPTITKTIDSNKLWNKIIHNAWKSAEPGILFWDTIIKESIPDCYSGFGFRTVSTNPCGEIPLCPYDSCRLLALNLFGYVVNPFTDSAYFNWKLFKSDARLGMRFMDDIIDLEIEKIDAILAKIESDPENEFIKLYEKNLWQRIQEMTKTGRRTGLGITAEGDMLAALGFRYGTDKANDFAEEVQKTLKLEAYRASVQLAKERGKFPIYNSKLELNNPFINRIKEEDPELYYDMVRYGRRNIALLTIAPTGTVSLMTQTTSGGESAFMAVYMRRRKINPQEKNVRIDFVDSEGVSWTEYPVFHHKFEMWATINGYDIDAIKEMSKSELDVVVRESPYYMATANDVDWVKKVEMQGRLQKHVDHSISVTVNLPNNVDEEIVSKVYETGWSSGCKGITVYRDGSRDGVLISNAEKKENEKMQAFKDTQAPKRPKKLKGEIIRFNNNNEKWIAVVGLLDERPYEMFTGKFENGLSDLPSYLKDCEIVKNRLPDGSKRYDIEYVDNNGLKQVLTGLSHKFNPEFWNYAKLLSGILRHGMPLIYVKELIESLNLNDDNLNTWKNGVTRVIKRYIKDGVKAKGKCPDCGGEHLEYIEGCLTCKDCGGSKCS